MDGLDGEERAHLRNRMVGFVFQHHYLLDELDALDNVALPLTNCRKGREEFPLESDETSRGGFAD